MVAAARLGAGVVEGEGGAEVHGGDVVKGAGEHLVNDDAVGALGGVEGVPEDVDAAVGAEVGGDGAETDPVVRSLAAASFLGRLEACGGGGRTI